MDLQYLERFNVLAKEQNYARAAEVLHISQPALSIQIKKLEEQLNTKLFDRSGNRSVLNENGQLLFEYSRRIFDLTNEAEQSLQKKRVTIEGNITVGGSNTAGTYIMPKMIGSFLTQHPKVNVNLHIGNTNEIARQVATTDMDFAINGGTLVYPDHVFCEKMMDDDIVFVTSTQSTLPDIIDDFSLLNHTCFISHEPNSQLYKVVQQVIADLSLSCGISMSFGSIDAIKQAVAANLGVSAIPMSAAETELKYGLLKKKTFKNKEWLYPYSLLYNTNRYMSPAATALMLHVKKELQALQAARSSEMR